METKKTTTEHSNVNVETRSINTVFKRDSIKNGAFKALAVLGAITIIYVGAYAIVLGLRNLPNIGRGITQTTHSARIFLADVFLFSRKVPSTATTTNNNLTATSTLVIATTTTPVETPVTTYHPPVTTRPSGTITAGVPTTHTYPGYSTSGGSVVSNPNGKPDLFVTIISYGTLDKSTNAYTATTTTISRSERIAIRFEVWNKGDKTNPTWRLNGYLPTYPTQIFNSDEQQAINPGDKIEYTLGFDQMQDQRQNTVKIEVDPSGLVNESNETNNVAQIIIPTL